MDLNHFYAKHQLSLMRAAAALSPESRAEHVASAENYAKLIAQERARHSPDGPRVMSAERMIF